MLVKVSTVSIIGAQIVLIILNFDYKHLCLNFSRHCLNLMFLEIYSGFLGNTRVIPVDFMQHASAVAHFTKGQEVHVYVSSSD